MNKDGRNENSARILEKGRFSHALPRPVARIQPKELLKSCEVYEFCEFFEVYEEL